MEQLGADEGSRRSTVDRADYAGFLEECVANANHRLWLKVPWIGPIEGRPARLLRAIRDCSGRGVDTRLLLRPEASNSPVLQTLASWKVPHRTVRYLHEKEMLVDDRLVVFSANFTPRELGRNDNHAYEIRSTADMVAAEAAFHDQWLLDEALAAAGDEAWRPADEVVPAELSQLLGRTRLNPCKRRRFRWSSGVTPRSW